MDDSGHISLFPEPAAVDSVINELRKNQEAEAEATRKKREYEDQYTMRFSNAAGFKTSLDKGPWYSSSTTDIAAQTVEDMLPNKDVWGNEDPRRQERERARISMSDPLMAMKRGVRQLRDVERERNKWAEEKKRELKVFKEERRERRDSSRHHRERRRRRGLNASHNSLDGFSLDAGTQPVENSRDRNRERSRKHRREVRERSQERSSNHMRSYVDSQSHKSSKKREKDWSKRPSTDK